MHGPLLRASLALLLPALAVVAQDGAALFTANCSACHVVDRAHVGPSLIEIARLYRGKPDAFLAWCREPQQKRPGMIPMPPMGHLGDERLKRVLGHILEVTKGKKEIVVRGVDRFRASPSMRKRPQVLRIFMPKCGPAAIAVAVDEDWSYCFDAGACRLRYVWIGDFVDGWPVWRGNGNALAGIVGEVVLREPASPLPVAADTERRFLGYRIENGLPSFRYQVGEVVVTERITGSDDGESLQRHFALSAPLESKRGKWRFVGSDSIDYESEHGSFAKDGTFVPAKGHEQQFTVTMREVR